MKTILKLQSVALPCGKWLILGHTQNRTYIHVQSFLAYVMNMRYKGQCMASRNFKPTASLVLTQQVKDEWVRPSSISQETIRSGKTLHDVKVSTCVQFVRPSRLLQLLQQGVVLAEMPDEDARYEQTEELFAQGPDTRYLQEVEAWCQAQPDDDSQKQGMSATPAEDRPTQMTLRDALRELEEWEKQKAEAEDQIRAIKAVIKTFCL